MVVYTRSTPLHVQSGVVQVGQRNRRYRLLAF